MEPTKKKYPVGLSPQEQSANFLQAMKEDKEATEAMPDRFQKGEMLEEVVNEDDTCGGHGDE